MKPSLLPRQYRTRSSRRMTGRPAKSRSNPNSMSSISSDGSASPDAVPKVGDREDVLHHRPHVRHPHHPNHIISQVAEWLHREKAKQGVRRSTRAKRRAKKAGKAVRDSAHALKHHEKEHENTYSQRSSSDASDTSVALHQLENILSTTSISGSYDGSVQHLLDGSRPSLHGHRSRKSSRLLRKKMSFGATSDSDVKDEVQLPSADVTLDNSAITGHTERRNSSLDDNWLHFKREIVRLTHTLRISGWRRIAINDGSDIKVERLSGALTNAVYVVLPPKTLLEAKRGSKDSTKSLISGKRPR